MMMRILVIVFVAGCHNEPADEAAVQIKRAQNAADLVEYRNELRACKAQGKDAGSVPVYEDCANKVDIKYGFADGGVK